MTMRLTWPWWVVFPLEVPAAVLALLVSWPAHESISIPLFALFAAVVLAFIFRGVTRDVREKWATPWLEGATLSGHRWRFFTNGVTRQFVEERGEWLFHPVPIALGGVVIAVRPEGPEAAIANLVTLGETRDRVSCLVRLARALYDLRPDELLTGRMANEASYHGIQSRWMKVS